MVDFKRRAEEERLRRFNIKKPDDFKLSDFKTLESPKEGTKMAASVDHGDVSKAVVTATDKALPKKRMTVKGASSGIRKRGRRFSFYGPEGVGKTTFAADSKNCVFFDLEGSSDWMPHVKRMPGSVDLGRDVEYNDVLDGIDSLIRDDHDFDTAVFDTADKLEALIWKHVNNREYGKPRESIEDWGFSKGYQYALDTWRDLCGRFLEELRIRRNMDIIFLGHSYIRTFKNPLGDDYDRYQMRLHDKAASFLKEYCDVVGFIQFETVVKRDEKTKRARGNSTGARTLHFVREAAWDAKSRFPLPDELPLEWAEFIKAIDEGKSATAAQLRKRIAPLLEELPDDWRSKLDARVKDCGEDTMRLSRALDYINGIIRTQERE